MDNNEKKPGADKQAQQGGQKPQQGGGGYGDRDKKVGQQEQQGDKKGQPGDKSKDGQKSSHQK